jgi:hypothetical protein
MALEIGIALAWLSDRRLSMPFEEPINGAPEPLIPGEDVGPPSRLLDLFEVPTEVVYPDEWNDINGRAESVRLGWPELGDAVYVQNGPVALDDDVFRDFSNGRTVVVNVPSDDVEVYRLFDNVRPLAFYSYFIYAVGSQKRELLSLLSGVKARRPFRDLGARIARSIGSFNAAHIRRTDLVAGIPAYRKISPKFIASTIIDQFPSDEPLLICTEADPKSGLFDPLQSHFTEVIFLNDLILGDWGREFFELPRHDENVLGLVTQEVATRARRFLGTMGSTFTALIQRQRLQRDPDEEFLFTGDYTPEGPRFRNGRFEDIREGHFTWNRIGLKMSADVLAWFREWPESV